MKKIISLAVVAVLVLVAAATTSHFVFLTDGVSIGIGTQASYDGITDATASAGGEAKLSYIVAALLIDAEGKVLRCEIDAIAPSVKYTAEGKVVAPAEYKTKYELGDAYGMKAYAGSALEWYEQADTFEAATVGKTLSEIKALMAENGKGNDDIVTAGCTIFVSDFVLAIENAFKNAKRTAAKTEDELSLAIISEHSAYDSKDATAESNGNSTVNTIMMALATSAEGKVSAAMTDMASHSVSFDTSGASKTDETQPLNTKRMLGYAYNMANYGSDRDGDGRVLEWFEQANAFDNTLVGKSAADISSLVLSDGYGSEEVVVAGCTVTVSDFVKIANKALAD